MVDHNGLSCRNRPWATMWASGAPTRPSVTARVVADSPASTRASGWQAATAAASVSATSSRGPAATSTCPVRAADIRLVSSHHRTDGASVIARPRSDGSARHGTAWRSAGRTRTMSWAASASGSTRRRSSSSTASRAARRRAASTVAPAPLVRVATRPRKAVVARSAARRISTIGPSSTTAERRPVITTATRSAPAQRDRHELASTERFAEITESHARGTGLLGSRRLSHPSVVQRSLEPRLARPQLVRW